MFLAGSGVSVLTGFEWVLLHEHEVPEEALVLTAGQVVLGAELESAVDVQLAARATGAGLPRLPEVLLAVAEDDPLARDADRQPGVDRLLVGPEADSSSPSKTVIQILSGSSPKPSVESCQASSAAPCLK